MKFVQASVLGHQNLTAQCLRDETQGGRGRLGAGRGKAQPGPHLSRPPDQRGHQQTRLVPILYRFGRQGMTVPRNAYLEQPGKCGRQNERATCRRRHTVAWASTSTRPALESSCTILTVSMKSPESSR